MASIRRHFSISLALVWLFGPLLSAAASSSTASQPSTILIADSTSTCRSKTVNYITHTLPQQCLRSAHPSVNSSDSSIPEVISTFSGFDGPASSFLSLLDPHPTQSANSGHSASDAVSSTITDPSSPINEAPSSTISSPVSTDTSDATATVDAGVETDAESPFDNEHFLSFEEWKKQNLARAGQSAEHLGEKATSAQGSDARRRPGNINNALDSLGEDSEIELDFGGFVSSPSGSQRDLGGSSWDGQGSDMDGASRGDAKEATVQDGVAPSLRSRSKDAGKTCKERFNYASFDCAATVLKTNPQCKGSSSILVENKDSYMLNECSATNKFLIVELCDIILVDTLVLANFEFFSSMFRTFRVSVSDRYPVKMDRWRELGTFEARNSREVQAFLVENPLIWAKYLRVEILTHFGNEYYCPVSLLRVHGTTMMEEFRHGNEIARGEEETEGITEMADSMDQQAAQDVVTADKIIQEINKAQATATEEVRRAENTTEEAEGDGIQRGQIQHVKSSAHGLGQGVQNLTTQTCPVLPGLHYQASGFNRSLSLCRPDEAPSLIPESRPGPGSSVPTASDGLTTKSSPVTASTGQTPIPHSSATAASTDISQSPMQKESTTASSSPASVRSSSNSTQDAAKSAPSSTHPPSANPTTQESFFKSVHKRLQLLESNSTLSLQYIEEQSRILRDAFTKVEKRQLNKTATFLENLNATVLTELRGFRQQYDQIWQSTVIELENHREQSQREVIAVSERLGILADEVIFQKRMSVVQSILLLLCIGLLLFSRGAAVGPLELPAFQNMMARSQSTLRLPFESPSRSPTSTRPNSRWEQERGFEGFSEHRRHRSDESAGLLRSPAADFSPPTPNSLAPPYDDRLKDDPSPSPERSEGLEIPVTASDRALAVQTKSSPASLSGRRWRKRSTNSWHSSSSKGSSASRTPSPPPPTESTLHRGSPLRRSEDLHRVSAARDGYEGVGTDGTRVLDKQQVDHLTAGSL